MGKARNIDLDRASGKKSLKNYQVPLRVLQNERELFLARLVE